MGRLPVVSAKDLLKVFQKEGYRLVRQRGSHMVLQKRVSGTAITVVIPNHKEIATGTLRSILKKANWTPDRLMKLLSVLAIVIRFQ